jgi:hypothetical protein
MTLFCGTEVTQTLYFVLYCAQCCSETENLVLFTELALNAICPTQNIAYCKLHTVQLTVTVTVIVYSMLLVDF